MHYSNTYKTQLFVQRWSVYVKPDGQVVGDPFKAIKQSYVSILLLPNMMEEEENNVIGATASGLLKQIKTSISIPTFSTLFKMQPLYFFLNLKISNRLVKFLVIRLSIFLNKINRFLKVY